MLLTKDDVEVACACIYKFVLALGPFLIGGFTSFLSVFEASDISFESLSLGLQVFLGYTVASTVPGLGQIFAFVVYGRVIELGTRRVPREQHISVLVTALRLLLIWLVVVIGLGVLGRVDELVVDTVV